MVSKPLIEVLVSGTVHVCGTVHVYVTIYVKQWEPIQTVCGEEKGKANMSGLKFSSPMKFEIEKFDGRINYGLWPIQVKDVLIQSGLHKALKRKSSLTSNNGSGKVSISNEDWENLDDRVASVIRLCLAKNVLTNVGNIPTTKELWEKLEKLY